MNRNKSWIEEQLQDPEFRRELAMERGGFEFVEQLEHVLSESGLSRSDLARRLGKSAAHITQALRRGRNLTIKTMVEIAGAVDHDVHIRLQRCAADAGSLFTVPMIREETRPVWTDDSCGDARTATAQVVPWPSYASRVSYAYEGEDTTSSRASAWGAVVAHQEAFETAGQW